MKMIKTLSIAAMATVLLSGAASAEKYHVGMLMGTTLEGSKARYHGRVFQERQVQQRGYVAAYAHADQARAPATFVAAESEDAAAPYVANPQPLRSANLNDVPKIDISGSISR